MTVGGQFHWQIPKKINYNYVRGQFTTFWQIPVNNNNYNHVRGQFTTFWQIQDKKNNYNYVRGQFTTFWQIPAEKNNYNYVKGQFTTFWQIPDKKIITIMWEGNLLPFDRFQKKTLQLCERAIYYLLTVRGQFQTRQNNYNDVRGQFTTFWQIPAEKNNYNHVRGQFTTFWQIPDKKIYNHLGGQFTNFWQIPYKKIITIIWEGNLPPFDRFQKKTIRLCERANYYLMRDSRKKNYNYVRGQFTTFWQIPDKKIITIIWEGNLLPFWQIPAEKNNYNHVKGQFTTFWQIPAEKK